MSKEGTNESDQCLLEEIEVIKAIFFSELDVIYSSTGRPIKLSITLYPSTADDTDQYYVCVTLVMKFPIDYPGQPPMLEFKNPRGLGDDFLTNVLKECNEKCNSFSGNPVIYEIIELVRESLTNSNRPTGHCSICLFNFHDEDVFTYTQCYHHFHSHCLSRYCQNLLKQWAEEAKQEISHNPMTANSMAAEPKDKKLKQFTCPVCRNEINVSVDALKKAPPPHESKTLTEEFKKDPKLAAWRRQMEQVYQQQKSKGGIIDQLAEDSRFLVVTETSNSGADATASPIAEEDRVVEASANHQQHNSRDQSKCGRGGNRNFRKPDLRGQKTRSTSDQNVPKSSNFNPSAQQQGSRSVPQDMDGTRKQQQQHPQQPRQTDQHNRGPCNVQPVTNAAANGQPCRPPPGFQPR